MRGPRFEQTNMDLQPQPLSAMAMIAEEPIRLVETRIASCNGGKSGCGPLLASDCKLTFCSFTGGGSLGHPVVYINVDKPGPKACG